MKEIVLATGNKHKVKEIKDILKEMPLKVLSIADFKNVPEVVEDGATLEDNAVKKAKTAALFLKKWVLSDDTGLEVEYLNGEPGVYSARWAGPGCSYEDNNKKLLNMLKDVPEKKRKACFKCVIAISDPEGRVITAEGKIDGIISTEISGTNGFGYDPLFFVPSQKKTFAELSSEVKNKISHRANALIEAKKIILKLINENKN